MSELPLLLRRGLVMEKLGVTSPQVTKFVEAGLLKPLQRKGGRFWFRRDEVLNLGKGEEGRTTNGH